MRRTAYIASVVIGVLLIAGGVGTYVMVSNTLADQNITVSDDASCLAGDKVDGPLSAYCEAQVIEQHALEATDGMTYAELPRDSELRPVAMNASFLRASLFTSVVAFGVAVMGILIGLIFLLLGFGMKDVGEKTGDL